MQQKLGCILKYDAHIHLVKDFTIELVNLQTKFGINVLKILHQQILKLSYNSNLNL